MDIVTLALCKKIAAGAVSGIKSYRVEGLNFILETNDGQDINIAFPSPLPKDMDVDKDNHLIFTMQDNTTLRSNNPIPKVKISTKEGNAIKIEPDGSLYVTPGLVNIDETVEGNLIKSTEKGLYAVIDNADESTKENILNIIADNTETNDIDFSDF